MTDPENKATDGLIRIEVAYALPERQVILTRQVAPGCSALEAVLASGIDRQFPDLDMTALQLGIFSRPLNGIELPLPQDYVLEAGDRVEIYRPLHRDPKQARLDRARKKQGKK